MSKLTAVAAHDHPLPSCRLPTGYINTTHAREMKTQKPDLGTEDPIYTLNTLEVHK